MAFQVSRRLISRTRWGLVAALLGLTLIVAGCSSSTPTAASTTTASSAVPSSSATSVTTTKASSASVQTPSATAGAAKVGTTTSALGTFLVDGKGITLYMWVADKDGKSACYDKCAGAWPPLLSTGAPTATGDATASLLGTVARTDGTMQVTYGKYPLYYFFKDKAPGDVTGQGSNGFDAKWWVLGVNGEPIPKEAAGPSSSG